MAGGLPSFSGGSPPYNYEAAPTRVSRRAAALPKEPSHHRWGVARSAQAMALEGLSLRMGVSWFEDKQGKGPLQACGRGHASRATPSRGLALAA